MGKTAADTRKEIEEARRQLTTTVAALRQRTVVVRGRVVRVAAIAGGALSVVGIGVVSIVLLRRRRGGPITQAARRLPGITHDAAIPIARRGDRWLTGRTRAARRQRDALVDDLATRIADNQAQAQRRANPLWRRAAGTALETAASAGVASLVRRAMSEPARGSGPASDEATDGNDLAGTRSAAAIEARPTLVEASAGH
jgi:hypothetical protein